jgi:hypothetical protein
MAWLRDQGTERHVAATRSAASEEPGLHNGFVWPQELETRLEGPVLRPMYSSRWSSIDLGSSYAVSLMSA